MKGGIPAIEVTLRSEAALESIRQIRMACTSVGVALAADFEERFCDHPAEASGRVLKDIRDAHEKALESLQDTHRERDKSGDDKSKDEDARQAAEIANLAGKYGFAYQEVREASPRGVFRSFAAFECGVVQQLFAAARGLNLTGGLHDVLAGRMSASGGDASAMARALVRAGRADAAGILAPSFARLARPDMVNLVLWRWGPDLPHRGFQAFLRLMDRYHPRYLVHGHVHPQYAALNFTRVLEYGQTTVVNAYKRYFIDL